MPVNSLCQAYDHYASQRSIHARFALFLRNGCSVNQNNFRKDESHWSERNKKSVKSEKRGFFSVNCFDLPSRSVN